MSREVFVSGVTGQNGICPSAPLLDFHARQMGMKVNELDLTLVVERVRTTVIGTRPGPRGALT